MPRSSNKDAARHRQQIVEAASELFRERGIDGVSVPEIMGSAGLTHGGFYRHFDSKEQLAALACGRAVAGQGRELEALRNERALLDGYLSSGHRDDRAHGCPVAALSGEVARAAPDSPVRAELTAGVNGFADGIAALGGHDRDKALARMSMLVGALVLSRATEGAPVSDEILSAARAELER
jgi:TetR/AcrR family transcriptional regulator, transcriptional repressor for nem operon